MSILIELSKDDFGLRLDLLLTQKINDTTRSQVANAIKEGHVTINDVVVSKTGYKIKAGDKIKIDQDFAKETPHVPVAESMDIPILYEDEDILVINKPAGIVVHPAVGNWTGTIVNALLSHCPVLSTVSGRSRAGIVHRLDKGTSGVMVVAKTDASHRELSRQFHDRSVKKFYKALVFGKMRDMEGVIDKPIGRSIRDRKRISSATRSGKSAITKWRVEKIIADQFSLLTVEILTGRTHQIRVHLSELGHPVVGDAEYGRGKRLAENFSRPALHAWRLLIRHPRTNEPMTFEAPLPDDMVGLIANLNH